MFMFWIVLFKLCYAQYRAVINQNVFSFIYNGDTYRYNISTIQKTLVSQPDSVVTASGSDWYYNIGGGLLSTTCSSPCVNSFSPVSGITSCVLLQVQGANYWCAGSAVSSYLTVSLISADPNAFGSGLRLTYINGQSGCGTGRKTVFNLNCDQTKTPGAPAFTNVIESPTCTYNMFFNAIEGCFVSVLLGTVTTNTVTTNTVTTSTSTKTTQSAVFTSSKSSVPSDNTQSQSSSSNLGSIISSQLPYIFIGGGVLIVLILVFVYWLMIKQRRLKQIIQSTPIDQSAIVNNSNAPSSNPSNVFGASNQFYNMTNYPSAQTAITTTINTNVSGGFYPGSQFYPNPAYGFNNLNVVPSQNFGTVYSQGFNNTSYSPQTSLTPGSGSANQTRLETRLETSVVEQTLGLASEKADQTTSGGQTIQWEAGDATVKSIEKSEMVMALPGHLQLDSRDYRLEKKVGAGGMGDIYHSSLLIGASEDIYVRTKGAKLVAKVMKSAGEKTFIQEVSIMSMFNQHKNFAQLVAFDKENMTILMIFYPLGSFDSLIKQPNRSLQVLFNINMGAINAICDLHKCGIVHNDIKSANILLSQESDGTIIAKLTDFGIAQVVENFTLLVSAFEVKSIRGFSLRYAAPEKLDKNFKIVPWERIRTLKSADTYSMAITIWESLCGDKPLF